MPRNLTDALVAALNDIVVSGDEVVARGQRQREVRGHSMTIDRSSERVLVLPGRLNNVFAQIAETAWVLAGRDDLDFLVRYLPRAPDFSDDGSTWRAAYGPRIRRWGGRVDQVAGVTQRLAEDLFTKRAVLTIFDPAVDYCETRDVPCNNWLHFLYRDGKVHLSVAVRANDAIWGFSGINFFEWSVLQEIVARSVGAEPGEINWFVGSLHVYERHYRTAETILRNREPRSPYEFAVPRLPITTGIDGLDSRLDLVMEVEQEARSGRYDPVPAELDDPFLAAGAAMLQIYNMFLDGRQRDDVLAGVAALPPSDLRVAAVDFLCRQWDQGVVDEVPLSTGEQDFLKHHLDGRSFLRATRPRAA